MNEIALESFISYCDNMMIANESMKSITDIYEKSLAHIKEIQEKVRRETLLKKRIALYTNLKSTLSDLKTALSHEKAIGIRDLPKLLVNALPGAIIGTLTIAGVKHYKKEGKTGDAKTTGIAGGFLTGLGLFTGLVEKTDYMKGKKGDYLRALDNAIKESDEIIRSYNCCIEDGITTISEYDRYHKMVKEDNAEGEERIKKALSAIKPFNGSLTDADVEIVQREAVAFLKKYVSSKEFKAVYKPYLHMIDIRVTEYSEPFSITFTDYQDGYDDDIEDPFIRDNTNWYYEVMEAGERFFKHRFGITVDTGDGDEGTLYINGL